MAVAEETGSLRSCWTGRGQRSPAVDHGRHPRRRVRRDRAGVHRPSCRARIAPRMTTRQPRHGRRVSSERGVGIVPHAFACYWWPSPRRHQVVSSITPTPGRSFLESFRDRGWYLVDLCRTPVNHCQPRARRQAHEQGVPGLARTLRRLRPRAIVLVVKMISPAVRLALHLAEWSGPYYELPYPGRWAVLRYENSPRVSASL
jgi:hypothetical protein